MVRTWERSWFAEEGLRVLYLLPRPWTDRLLPLTIRPEPRELTRVMVGRAELITPAIREELATLLSREDRGDARARAEAAVLLKRLGRFAEPAVELAQSAK